VVFNFRAVNKKIRLNNTTGKCIASIIKKKGLSQSTIKPFIINRLYKRKRYKNKKRIKKIIFVIHAHFSNVNNPRLNIIAIIPAGNNQRKSSQEDKNKMYNPQKISRIINIFTALDIFFIF
jgi:hypothetical protein